MQLNMKEKNLTIRINSDLKNSFKNICDNVSTTMSNRINDFIVKEVKSKELNNIGGYLVFYTEQEIIGIGEVKANLKQKIIPVNLKDLFLSEFKDKLTFGDITGEEIDKFLENNK